MNLDRLTALWAVAVVLGGLFLAGAIAFVIVSITGGL